ncbi:TetR/AcrR family transcriptional regulator [Streptomyces sp. 8L]|uniref:TetR/AcrR family transcriptional regulator n=1 Tax=Streptomyces sp. 8L TaxID=2877242 RepID=UPI001CD4020D|nr:TetR/AcrR family transcriptional regulator [Streptomyces sp. 8L]MCA1221301.1 TetR/AcrR family transcriptional regulator [Streptomyces sp. 8L]
MGVEERRRQLIGVALELLGRRAPDDVSIDDIATAAGISRPLVYHYFPGKQSLYDAALRRAADDLALRFEEPRTGPLGARLMRAMGRFFDFVEEHGPGFAALMHASSAAGTGPGGPGGSGGSGAVVDELRDAAYAQVLAHLDAAENPPARLRIVVRSWVSLVESTALTWLDGREVPRAELELQLVHDFAALAAVSAAHDEGMAALLRRALADEPSDGPFADLVARLGRLDLGRPSRPGPGGAAAPPEHPAEPFRHA